MLHAKNCGANRAGQPVGLGVGVSLSSVKLFTVGRSAVTLSMSIGALPQPVVEIEVVACADWKRPSTARTETSYVPATSGVKLNCVPVAVENATAVLPDGPASVQA